MRQFPLEHDSLWCAISLKWCCIVFQLLTLWLFRFRPHYNVNMKAVQVGHSFLNISTDIFETGDRKGTIIDSGTTLAYLPDVVYEPLVSRVCDV